MAVSPRGVSSALKLLTLSPHRVPILATAVQEELEKEPAMEHTASVAAAQVSRLPRTSRGLTSVSHVPSFDL